MQDFFKRSEVAGESVDIGDELWFGRHDERTVRHLDWPGVNVKTGVDRLV